MKIKIIDLLVNISQGEKMPKKIKYGDYVWEYDKVAKDYYRNDIDRKYIYLFRDLFKRETDFFINDEAEIIEEPKKIEHCKGYEDFDCMDEIIEHLREKIDTLIDEVNKMKEKK